MFNHILDKAPFRRYACFTSAQSLVGFRTPFMQKVPSTLHTAVVLFCLPYDRLHGGADQVRRSLLRGSSNLVQPITNGFEPVGDLNDQQKEPSMADNNNGRGASTPQDPLNDTVERLWRMYGVICTLQILAGALRDSEEHDSFASALEVCAHVLQAEWDVVMNTAYNHLHNHVEGGQS